MTKANFNIPNKTSKTELNQTNSKKLTYDSLRKIYDDYTQRMDKSDFANSFTRYQVELNFLKDMYQHALEEGKNDAIKYIKERYSILSEKFMQFGVVLKELN